ncbi:hypothetical protein SLS62_000144 [Diatrype stigma]|uniref:Uncharacterized protein n=1 Tax=Diatrype stigma TaxID=117547 RepID=A0AAN9V1D2_9PEZI
MAEPYNEREILESLTFGVEFEFLVDARVALGEDDEFSQRVLENRHLDPPGVARTVAPVVKMYLERLGLSCPVSVSNKIMYGTYENDVERDEDERQYRHWIVKGIEVVSPVLPNTQDALDEVAKVAEALRDGDGDLGACVSFNQNCAFQVHVGRRSNLDFPLPVLQKLTSLLWMGAEELLDLVHPKFRIGGHWCKSLRADCSLARKLERDGNNGYDDDDAGTEEEEDWVDHCRGARDDGDGDNDERAALASPTDVAALRAIWQAQTTSELFALVGNGAESMAYDFIYLVTEPSSRPQDKGFKRTIEFREADGDLRNAGGDIICDPGYAAAWAAVATALVAFSARADKAELGRVIRETGASLRELEEKQREGIFAAAACRGEIVGRFLDSIGAPLEAADVMSARAVTSR